VKVRPWCKKHQIPLENFEGSNLLFLPLNEPGVWEDDLSDHKCPKENLEEDDKGPIDDCSWSWIIELLHYSAYVGEDPYTKGEYATDNGLDVMDTDVADADDTEELARGADTASQG
jgi:hypothetical protein